MVITALLYCMQWTDQIRRIKIILVVAAVLIAVASLLISHFLVRDLSNEEHHRMEVWAQALHALNAADETTDLSLVVSVMEGNNTIPVIVMNDEGEITDYRNIEDTTRIESYARRMIRSGDTIHVDGQIVCYDESIMLKRLSAWPYIQLGIVLVFVVVAIFALLSSKRAEQNKVWVGLSKETAHQLGTPVSSLMAWVEMLKEQYPVESSMNEVLEHVVDYMDRRTSNQVQMVKNFPNHDVIVKMNASLFEWVVENLCKNAVDAMEGKGTIMLTLTDDEQSVTIDVQDTGKGIKKKDINNVFTPGFTTKKRGWGLGLSLAKRIVEEYHKGRIFVKQSEIGLPY